MSSSAQIISSRTNPVIKKIRAVLAGKDSQLFFLEGVRILEEAFDAKMQIATVCFAPDFAEKPRNQQLLHKFLQQGISCFCAAANVLQHISGVEHSQGIVAIAHKPQSQAAKALQNPQAFLLVLAGIGDPGNLGTLIRTAVAAGVDGILLTANSVSPWNPKVVRASMGALFRIPLQEYASLTTLLKACKEQKISLFSTDAHTGTPYQAANYSFPLALCLGGEAKGIPEEIRQNSRDTLKIELHNSVESLNVAAAGAVLLFNIANVRKIL